MVCVGRAFEFRCGVDHHGDIVGSFEDFWVRERFAKGNRVEKSEVWAEAKASRQ
jgi:hypothetical protein